MEKISHAAQDSNSNNHNTNTNNSNTNIKKQAQQQASKHVLLSQDKQARIHTPTRNHYTTVINSKQTSPPTKSNVILSTSVPNPPQMHSLRL